MSSAPTYHDAVAHLSALIPELFSVPGMARRKFSLAEIGLLSGALGSPHVRFPSVLIAGTNGKGSTAATLASIGRAAGLRVGLYTSPHLDRVNERIRLLVPGAAAETGEIPDAEFAALYFRVHDAAQRLVLDGVLAGLPSYFELLTALAFLYFAESGVDLAVLEVGMGGRLDATNLVEPVVSVITDISLDHQEWLGATIDLIAREKAGILRAGGVLVTLPQHPLANQALGEVAVALDVRGVAATAYMPGLRTSGVEPYEIEVLGERVVVDSPLKGAHQHRNVALAIAAAVELGPDFKITAEAVARGIRETRWPGRLERLELPGGLEVLLDVAHNPAGAWALRSALSARDEERVTPRAKAPVGNAGSMPGMNPLPTLQTDSSPARGAGIHGPGGQVLIFACLRDKPLREMTQILFPLFDHVVLAPIQSPRATDVAELLAAAEATGVPSTAAETVAEAIELALGAGLGLQPARVVVSGSVYLVGEARGLLLRRAGGPVEADEL